ncbi:Adenylate kinase [Candidatus Erwinia haradaeae]|uniref:Adenylate kinase n=1 Tax=Candidatus Erwinia haradaeae TaxID=1922217 RepID=A0A451DCU6_9GAMM|nr:adenylate kinase [Candidatus Erwinia haradaeae]VFP84288.1 Adenylate kinase [Candidatus Erwinia haradaeae]
MRIILLGTPGSGKGTQAQFIVNKYGIPKISTGDMLRTAVKCNWRYGEKIKKIMDAGRLVSDEIVIALVKERICQTDCSMGFLLDGFPRTLLQAHALQASGVKIDHVLELCLSDELAMRRISGRRIHERSGRIYHVNFNPPKVNGRDDITGEILSIREDDQEEVVYKRLTAYHKMTVPLTLFYGKEAENGYMKYHQLDGSKSVTQIYEDLTCILSENNTNL